MTSTISRRSFLGGSLAGIGTFVLASCTSTTTAAGTREVTYEYLVSKAQPDQDLVNKAVNDLLKKRGMGFTVKLKALDTQTFQKRIPLDLAAGNAGDLMFTAPWANNYALNSAKGFFLPLDDYLDTKAPKLKASMSDEMWNAARINGKIYGAINQQLFPPTWGFIARKDVADKFGFDAEAVTSLDDAEPFLKQIKGDGKFTPMYTDNAGTGIPAEQAFLGLDTSFGYAVAIKADDPNLKVFRMYERDEFREFCKRTRRWREAGYMAATPPSTTDATAAFNNGQIAFKFAQAHRTAVYPFEIVQKSLIDPLLTTGAVVATLTAINKDAKNPKDAVAWLELVNTDKELYNLLCFGIEGKHYRLADAATGFVDFPNGTDLYNPQSDWVFGNQFNAYYRDETAAKEGLWEKQKAINESAKRSEALGFSFDGAALNTENANITSVMTQYLTPLLLGQIANVDAGVNNLNSRLKSAGIEKAQTELQKQLDAWKKNA
ncbi:ABC transporter substrate-binding protein [Rugosimonospora africana]|uniref:ABC transporter substrate-binding protein n=2 Tax=Rugosimonospora africana TaxID=556532 RepID=A0A8J3VUC8_9ACTN|nr:ABC transporter substrate-binding protein [Rugosimonospora africana]